MTTTSDINPTVLYTGIAAATGGRDGRVKSDDGHLDIALVTPKALGGAGGDGTNPEQLFAAGYAACFTGAVKYVASQQKLATGDFTITGHAGLHPDAVGFRISVELEAHFPGLSETQAIELMKTAHTVCPYSKAIHGNVEVKSYLV